MISETSKARHLLLPYCVGNGVDIGSGGDPIKPDCISIDLPTMYTCVGESPINLRGDGTNLFWFQDEVLPFLFSSHLLEDFIDTQKVLEEWCRVLEVGGRLVLLLPDQQKYVEYCESIGAGTNEHHCHHNFSASFVKERMPYNMQLIYDSGIIYEYNFALAYVKTRK
jgi:predicted SAM-dependent methyltransferase